MVIELKRTDDGGHVELQALRYAAMVSSMTFDEVATAYSRHCALHAADKTVDPRAELADFLAARIWTRPPSPLMSASSWSPRTSAGRSPLRCCG